MSAHGGVLHKVALVSYPGEDGVNVTTVSMGGRARAGTLATLAMALLGLSLVSVVGVADAASPIPAAPSSIQELVSASGADDANCGANTYTGTVYTTIGSALAVARPNDTVYVCAGTYAESVTVPVDISLVGAQHGVAATAARGPESIISSPGALSPVTYVRPATTGTINGFTLDGGGNSTVSSPGISAFTNEGDGYTWTDTLITRNTIGINFNTTGITPTVISGNAFVNNNTGTAGGDQGYGIFFTSGPAKNVTISNNSFSQNRGPDINTGAAENPSAVTGLTITGNTSTDEDNNFLVLVNTVDAQITDNAVTNSDLTDPNVDSAFFISGNTDPTVAGNTASGGTGASAYRVTDQFGPNSGVTLNRNVSVSRLNGVYATGVSTAMTVENNTIAASAADGIHLAASITGATVAGNSVSTSTTVDCADDSTGTATSKTANTWTTNTGRTSSPAGLCNLPTPTLTTMIAPTAGTTGAALSDTATLTGTRGQPGSLAWKLLGPIVPVNRTCAGLKWAEATLQKAGAIAVTADGTVKTPAVVVGAAGCYSFTNTLTGPTYATPVSVPAGQPSETALISRGAPSTTAGARLAALPDGGGYWVITTTGKLGAYGSAVNHGSMAGRRLNGPIVGITSTPDGSGYWLVGSDGGVFSFGDAHFYGSAADTHLNRPVVAMTSTPDGRGYWLVGSDGGVFSFGDAHFYGSAADTHLNRPVVAMTSTPDGRGYWLVGSDGGVFSFGDAHFYGSAANTHLNRPMVGITTTPDGNGYWTVASDGGVFTYGDAAFHGSLGNKPPPIPIIGLYTTHAGRGYTLVNADATPTPLP